MRNSIKLFSCAALCAVLTFTMYPAVAQTSNPPPPGGYQVGESAQQDASKNPPPPANAAGTRQAKIEYSSGDVTWRPDGNANWKAAKPGAAISTGAQIWAAGNGKVEIRFDDGGVVRIGHDAIATLDTMYNDAQGSFTRVVLNSGLGMLSLKNGRSVYEVALPDATIDASGPARVRVGAEGKSYVAVRAGKAVIQNRLPKPVKTDVVAGRYASISPSEGAVSTRALPPPDSWDRWNDERDHLVGGYYNRPGFGGSIVVPVIIEGGFGPHWHRHW